MSPNILECKMQGKSKRIFMGSKVTSSGRKYSNCILITTPTEKNNATFMWQTTCPSQQLMIKFDENMRDINTQLKRR